MSCREEKTRESRSGRAPTRVPEKRGEDAHSTTSTKQGSISTRTRPGAREKRYTHRDQIVRGFFQASHTWVVHDPVRQVQLVGPIISHIYIPTEMPALVLTSFAYSMRAQHGLHPLVSRRIAMYDSRSGMLPDARSRACWATARKNSSNVSMNRRWAPGDAVADIRRQKLCKTWDVSNAPDARSQSEWEAPAMRILTSASAFLLRTRGGSRGGRAARR